VTLTHPSALWLLVLLPIPLLLARRRTPARRLAVANLYLWQSRIQHETARPTLRRIRRHWLVVLQTAFLATLVAALARPTLAISGTRMAFVVDVSGSMAAREGPVSRLDQAKERARAILQALPARARVRVIAAGARPRELGDYASTDGALAEALNALAPTSGPADLRGALDLVRIVGDTTRIYVFSDRARNEGDDRAETNARTVSWETVGHSVDNMAVDRIAARRSPHDARDGQILVEVRNYGAEPRDADVEIAQDGRIIARASVHVGVRGAETIGVPASPLGRIISASLLRRDALDADNRRWGIVPPQGHTRVGLASGGNPFLQKALAVNPAVILENVSFDAAGEIVGPATASQPDVVVCEACGTLPSKARGLLVLRSRTAGAPAPAVLTIARPDHQIAAALDLGALVASPTIAGDLAANGTVVVKAGGQPAVIAYEQDRQRIVEVRLDLAASDVTLSPAFPILMANAVDWLSARDESPLEIESGEPLRWTLADVPATEALSVTGPDGRSRDVDRRGQRLTVVDTDLPGIYHVRSSSSDSVFAVNPAVSSESDLTSTAPEQAPLGPAPASPLPGEHTAITRPLLLLAAGLFAAEWWFRRGRSAWRLAIATCLLLGALGWAVVPRTAHMEAVAMLDRSASMPTDVQERGLARVHALGPTMRRGDRLGVVAFGTDATVEARPTERARVAAGASTVIDTGTNIANAITLATRLLPRQGLRRLLLYSDGRQTAGDARKAALAAADAGIRVDVMEPDFRGVRQPLVVTRAVAPSEVRTGEPFQIAVEVEGEARAHGRLRVYRDDELFATREIDVPPDGEASAVFSDQQPHAGVHVYRALMEAPDDDFGSGSDAGSGVVVAVSGEPHVLYVATSAGDLPPVIAGAGFRVTRVPPESFPTSLAGLAAYDAVVLDDVPAERLARAGTSALARYVEPSGGGLLLLGSSRSLNVGGYPTTALGQILPIDLRPRGGQRAPALGLVLVFDKSGSMADLAGGTPKIELARQAVTNVLNVLPPTDALGVIAFDAEPVIVAPLSPGPDARAIADRLRAIEGGGQTRIAPAAELAVTWLRATSSTAITRRQILLISDGRTSAEDADRLRKALVGAGVEVSVVAVGANADRALLTQLAQSTGGRAYFPDDVADLPMVVSREAARSTAGSFVTEPFTVHGSSHPILAGIDRTTLPQLGGYVVATAKPTAANVLASHLGDPILSTWRAGLGRVGVFTADLNAPGSASFHQWKDYGRLWVQSLRWVSRQAEDASLHVAIAEREDGMRVTVDAEHPDGSFSILADPRLVVRFPAGDHQDVALAATAPGRYEAHLPVRDAGPYVVAVNGQDRNSGVDHRLVQGFYWSADRERRAQGPDLAFLRSLAAATGGRLIGPTDSPFDETRPREYVDVSAWVVAAALALFLVELVTKPGRVTDRLPPWLFGPGHAAWNRRAA
jgi:Mg-chelatase subunit ChlD